MTVPPKSTAAHTVSVREILNYFAKCPRCGYPAQASVVQRTFVDGNQETEIVATCGLPCGWSGLPTGASLPMRQDAVDCCG